MVAREIRYAPYSSPQLQQIKYFILSICLPVSAIPSLLTPYHRSLDTHLALVDILRSHSVSFEDARDALAKWAEQPWLEDDGWEAVWEDLCAAEVERWDVSK